MIFTQENKAKAFNLLLKKILVETDKSIYSVTNTTDKINDGYDCLATQFRKITNLSREVSKKMFFEGIYTDSYSAIFLKKETLELLKSVIDNPATDNVYYVNFTPRNTYIFDLLKLESDGKLLFMDGDLAYLDITNATEVAFSYSSPLLFDINPELRDFVLNNEEEDSQEPDLKMYKVDNNGDLFFESQHEFMLAPYHVKRRHLMERHINLNLLPPENKKDMLEKYETIEKLYFFLKERSRKKFLSKYGYIDPEREPNKYEIK